MKSAGKTVAAFPEFSKWSDMASKLVRYGQTGLIYLRNRFDMPSKLLRYALETGPICLHFELDAVERPMMPTSSRRSRHGL